MFEIIIFILIGCILGIITGLTPGIHINLVSAIIVSLLPFLLKYISNLNIIIIIISMAVIHAFLNSIPSIFLGAPSPDSAIIILPAHKLLLKGKAHEAVILTLIGTLGSIILTTSLIPLLIFILPKFYLLTKPYIAYILISASIILILKEKKRLLNFIIFILAGTLGLIVLNIPNIKEPLLPLLSGLFGLSSLILSIKNNTKIPEQKTKEIKIKTSKLKYIIIGVISGILSSFFPGLGSSQISALSSSLIKKVETKDYIILNSTITSTNMIGSFIALYAINKGRSGTAVAISRILENFSLTNFLLIISVILITTFIATLLTINFSKIFSRLITKINYKTLCILIIFLIASLVLLVSKPIGLLVLFISTNLGIFTQLKEINKNLLMGCLIIPVILFFLL